MPSDAAYLPIHAGCAGKAVIGFEGDNSGDNISEKNADFCELSVHYYGWKNISADFLGLSHYRRHFRGRLQKAQKSQKSGGKWNRILTGEEAAAILRNYDAILPGKRRYFIETNYSHYIHAHDNRGVDIAAEIIRRDYPEYTPALETVFYKRTYAHMFNMLIMKRDIFDRYSEWLFDILFKTEAEMKNRNITEPRVFGFISELLLDIFLETNHIKYKEIPVMFMEKQNWLKKGGAFLLRKIKGRG
jgi:hypothetical protein